jgi:hypothetical protein
VNKVYMVAVESKGLTTDWINSYIVIASSPEEAARLAIRKASEEFSDRSDVAAPDIYELSMTSPRVVGRLVNE